MVVLERGDDVSGAMFYKVAQQWLRKERHPGRGRCKSCREVIRF